MRPASGKRIDHHQSTSTRQYDNQYEEGEEGKEASYWSPDVISLSYLDFNVESKSFLVAYFYSAWKCLIKTQKL